MSYMKRLLESYDGFRTAEDWRPVAVDFFGKDSPAVAWLDMLIADGNGNPMAASAVVIMTILEAIHKGGVE